MRLIDDLRAEHGTIDPVEERMIEGVPVLLRMKLTTLACQSMSSALRLATSDWVPPRCQQSS